MYSDNYLQQVHLLLQCLPALRKHPFFALKGGTAINLFVQDLPRLSVDIDLTYFPIEPREVSLNNIQQGLNELAGTIKQMLPQVIIKKQFNKENNLLLKLYIYFQQAMIKIEPNFIMRGSLYPIAEASLSQRVNDDLDSFLDQVPMLSPAELYAGKICAALNRQHPRDLFDIKILMDKTGITESIRKAFVVYLACNPRPIYELLSPNLLDIELPFKREFLQMTDHDVSLGELLEVRDKLIKTINRSLTDSEREFLLSLKSGAPQFDLLSFENLDQLPALRWKIMNIQRMDKQKNQIMYNKLSKVLENG